MTRLPDCDVLSFSSGTDSEDPFRYRIVRPVRGLLPAVSIHAPGLVRRLHERPPLVIQAYPATLGLSGLGPLVDTYLNPHTACRALDLAVACGRDALVCATPLMAAHILRVHIQRQAALPGNIILALGGYPLPLSLERALRSWCGSSGAEVSIVQFYGQSEIDSALLFSLKRDQDGNALYHPREGVRIHQADGATVIELEGSAFEADDEFSHSPGGWIVRNTMRWRREALDTIEQWSERQWRRRTGYMAREVQVPWRCQLREGECAESEDEIGHFAFCERYGMAWYRKPAWGPPVRVAGT